MAGKEKDNGQHDAAQRHHPDSDAVIFGDQHITFAEMEGRIHRLAGYKKPRRVVFVDEMPRNAAGKILKRQLREKVLG